MSVPPCSPEAGPLWKQMPTTRAPFLELSFIHLSKVPVYEPQSRFPSGKSGLHAGCFTTSHYMTFRLLWIMWTTWGRHCHAAQYAISEFTPDIFSRSWYAAFEMYEVTLGFYCVNVIWSPEERVHECPSGPVWTGSASGVIFNLHCDGFCASYSTSQLNCSTSLSASVVKVQSKSKQN